MPGQTAILALPTIPLLDWSYCLMAMKWFRKHDKKILVVGGALLMIAFLLPQSKGCQGPTSSKDYPLGQAYGKKIMLSEARSAARELAILQGIQIQQPVADPVDYVLLLREAKQMQLPTGPKLVDESVATTVAKINNVSSLAQLAQKFTQQQQSFPIDEKLLRQTLGNFITVRKAHQLVLGVPQVIPQEQGSPIRDFRSTLGLAQPSEKELEILFRDISEQLDVEYVSFPAWRYDAKVRPATDDEILAQFETYKNNYPGTEENEFGFGYNQPLTLKIEYLKIDLEDVKAKLQRPSPETVRQYYDKHKQFYVLPAEENLDAQDDTPATPAQYKPFEQVYEDLESRWLQEQARNKGVEIIGEARRLARNRWEQLKEDNTPITPENLHPYAGAQQESLVNWLKEKFGILAQYKRAAWIDIDQTETLPGIGQSYSRTQPILGFSQIASMVRQPNSETPDAGNISLELGQDCPVNMQDAQSNIYLFRVVGLRRDQAPDASQILDDPQLARKIADDLLAKRAYEYALDQARRLLPLAQKQGLENALAKFGDENAKLQQAGMIRRADSNEARQELIIPLIDSAGKTHGQVQINLQMVQLRASPESLPTSAQILQIKITNPADEGRITALGITIPRYLRMVSPFIKPLSVSGIALNGGEPVPAGPEGYTVRYFARGINAGQAGKFDLLLSEKSQELLNSPNLSKTDSEPEQTQNFQFMLPARLPARLVDFVQSSTGSAMVARLETGGKTQLLMGSLPANRQDKFLRGSFSVLDSASLLRKPEPKQQTQENLANDADEPDPATTRTPDLLTESLYGQAPCTLIESPRSRICYVISAGKHLPLSRAQFDSSRQLLLNSLARDNHTLMMRNWLDSGNIRSRTGFIQAQLEAPPNEDSP